MVFNLQQDYDTDIRNTAEYFKRVEYDGIPYGIWIFEKGTFTNKGDGGWINWGFYGNFERDGKDCDFSLILKSSRKRRLVYFSTTAINNKLS